MLCKLYSIKLLGKKKTQPCLPLLWGQGSLLRKPKKDKTKQQHERVSIPLVAVTVTEFQLQKTGHLAPVLASSCFKASG